MAPTNVVCEEVNLPETSEANITTTRVSSDIGYHGQALPKVPTSQHKQWNKLFILFGGILLIFSVISCLSLTLVLLHIYEKESKQNVKISHLKEEIARLNQETTTLKSVSSSLSQNISDMQDIELNHTVSISTLYQRVSDLHPGRDCAEIMCRKEPSPSGVYKISPDGKTTFDVYCDMATSGGGWTTFQRRIDGSENFYRIWKDYKTGFGSVKKEFWVGNDRLNLLTHMAGRKQRLRVDLWSSASNRVYAEYGTFLVDNEAGKYKLTVGAYSGDVGDSLAYHNGQYFTTKDRDNDASSDNCAVDGKGAWWYDNCFRSNLNGRYLNGQSTGEGVIWKTFMGFYTIPRTEMKIRPTNFSGCKK